MGHQLKLVFKSSKFVTGFIIFMTMFLLAILFPIFSMTNPLEMTGGLFYKPGTYISVVDVVETKDYDLKMDVVSNRLAKHVTKEEQNLMLEWLTKYCTKISKEELNNLKTSRDIVKLWLKYYDPDTKIEGATIAYKKKFPRLFKKVENILNDEGYMITKKDAETGELNVIKQIPNNSYVNTKDIVNKKTFVLGTDNFGRDVFIELTSAIGNSLKIGFVAGSIATILGLVIGLLAGYVGGFLDNVLTFITNLFTVIPSFVILVLISVSVGEKGRDVMTTALVIGITSWPWTARSVRSQTISLRNRDHVNLSRLSGHSLFKIILTDILPYVASYVVMAYILQIASGILSEAQLSMIGLGPSTTEIATLGLMLNWAMQFQAPLSGAWWAFIPVILSIALITFSLNLMNTGLDQIFNPQLRD
ncbi:MAG: ABC transporter permease [Xylanivirga thermophila]|jgi:ABC-type dipeptide/oligopeptide/nickel transport system permease subunit